MSIYTNPEFDALPEYKSVDGVVCVPEIVKSELKTFAEESLKRIVDIDFIKVDVTGDSVVYDVYTHKYTADELRKLLNAESVMKFTRYDDVYGTWCRYYVTRVIAR